MGAADTARLVAALELDNSKFLRGVSSSLGGLGKLDKSLGKVGRGFGRLGGGLGKAALIGGGAIVAGLGASAKAAIDFQDAFQGVVKTVDENDLKKAGLTFDDLSDSIRQMAREMPNSATELAGIAESAGALGVKAKDITAFTKQVAILASTTNVSADDAATALGQLQNVIGLTGDEFDNFTAALVDLGNKGASTEAQILEIERRAGGAAKLIGVAKDATLGWSAAAANLGLNEELAGTALQKFFLTASQNNQKLAKVAGVSGAAFKKMFTKDASGALELFLKKLGKMPKDARLKTVQSIFGKSSGLTRLILGLSDSVDKNLNPALKDSVKAWHDATAAQAEFDKRNATVKSAFSRLKNNVIDAAISIGEGFAPALGRAADKLSAFLADPKFRTRLQDIGKEIGSALDQVDWGKLLTVAESLAAAFKPALDIILKIAGKIAELPPGVVGGAGALLVTDKVTGGAISGGIGGIIGGLGESLAKSLAAKIPLFGSAFVQPVFVTNQGFALPGAAPVGGGGGGGGGEGGGGTGAKVGGTAGAGIAILDMHAFNSDLAGRLRENDSHFAQIVATRLEERANKDTPWDQILIALGLQKARTAPADNTTGMQDFRAGERASWTEPLAGIATKQQQTNMSVMDTAVAVRESGKANEIAQAQVKDAARTGLSAVDSTTRSGTSGTTSAVNNSASRISGAIAANRPIVTTNVDVNITSTGVAKATVTSNRYGPSDPAYSGPTRKYDKP